MGIVVVPTYGSDPATVNAANLDAKVSGLATEFNGGIDNDNIDASAAIAYSKLNLTGGILNADINASAAIADSKLATISTSQKVNLSALVATSQAQGDIIYASSATAMARLGAGTDGQVLQTQGAAANPKWGDLVDLMPDGTVVQVVNTQSSAADTFDNSGGAITMDDDIPQITEGKEFITASITPNATTNKLKIDVVMYAVTAADGVATIVGLFQDTTANALAAGFGNANASSNPFMVPICFTYYMAAGTTSSTTFRVRFGGASGVTTVNGFSGARKLGGKCYSSITITEIKAS